MVGRQLAVALRLEIPRSSTRLLRHRALRRESLGDSLEVLVRHDMISPLARLRLTLLLLATIAMGHPRCGLAQGPHG